MTQRYFIRCVWSLTALAESGNVVLTVCKLLLEALIYSPEGHGEVTGVCMSSAAMDTLALRRSGVLSSANTDNLSVRR